MCGSHFSILTQEVYFEIIILSHIYYAIISTTFAEDGWEDMDDEDDEEDEEKPPTTKSPKKSPKKTPRKSLDATDNDDEDDEDAEVESTESHIRIVHSLANDR